MFKYPIFSRQLKIHAIILIFADRDSHRSKLAIFILGAKMLATYGVILAGSAMLYIDAIFVILTEKL